jgi:hypothetical protein
MNSIGQLQTAVLRTLMTVALLASPTFSIGHQEFDHDSYKQITLDDILENPPDIQEGLDIFVTKRQFLVKVERLPESCTAVIIGRVLRMRGVSEVPEVSHCMQVSSPKGKPVQVFVEDVLVEGLKKDVKQGDTIKVYAIYLYYSAVSKSHGILISAFYSVGYPES